LSSRLRIGIIVAVIGIVLIVLGGVAVFRLYQQSTQQIEPEEVVVDVITVDVVTAKRDILIGTLLTEGDLAIVQIPVEFATRDTIANFEDAAGKILKVDLVQGEMVLAHNLADPTATTHDIAYVLSDTHVLFALPATDLMGRESVIQRGDIVDLFATVATTIETVDENDNRTEQTETVTFASHQRLDITAMVVDIITEDGTQQAEGDEDEGLPRDRVIIQAYLLALDPQDALIMKYLKDVGAVFDFVLRAPTSRGQFNLTPVTKEYLKELYGLEILP
jgi:Flp pilus assembly protein CpaB